jgi:hypothetical protein
MVSKFTHLCSFDHKRLDERPRVAAAALPASIAGC